MWLRGQCSEEEDSVPQVSNGELEFNQFVSLLIISSLIIEKTKGQWPCIPAATLTRGYVRLFNVNLLTIIHLGLSSDNIDIKVYQQNVLISGQNLHFSHPFTNMA